MRLHPGPRRAGHVTPDSRSRPLRPLRPLRRRAAVAVVVALAAVVALAGCGASDPSLPRVGDRSAGASAEADNLVAVAKKFHDCLADAGLPATYEDDENGQPTRVTLEESVVAVGIDTEGLPFANDAGYETRFDQYFDDREDFEPALEVDGVDRTETWITCLGQSDYSVSATFDNSANDAFNQEIWRLSVDASNKWAACARDHGFPETKDAVMPTDDNSYPMALLPVSITEPQLRQLLIDCPNFDAEQEKKNEELMRQTDVSGPSADAIPEGVVMTPSIGFDYPGFRSGSDDPSSDSSDDATADRLMGLMDILTQAEADYYATQAPG